MEKMKTSRFTIVKNDSFITFKTNDRTDEND